MLWLMGHQGFYSTLKRKDGKGSLASMNKAGERTRSRNGITVVVLGDSTKQFWRPLEQSKSRRTLRPEQAAFWLSNSTNNDQQWLIIKE